MLLVNSNSIVKLYACGTNSHTIRVRRAGLINIRDYTAIDKACHAKCGSPYLVPPGPNISKYLDPQIISFNFAEIFGPPELKFLNYLDRLEIFYPLSNLH